MKKEENISGELTDYPNLQYKKFFDKFSEIDTVEVTNWKPVHLIAHFCKKYKEAYNTDYKFKFNSPAPSKCFEVFQMKKLAMQLSSQPTVLKEYIDWMYQTRVVQAKRKLTSISFLTVEDIVNDYKINILLAGKRSSFNIDRATNLPDNYKQVLHNFNMPALTYGDLSFVLQMTPEKDQLLESLKSLGFDEKILEKII